MSCFWEICPLMATFDAAQLIQVNFEVLSMNWLRMSFADKDLQTLCNTAPNGPVWPHLVNGDHVCSRIWSMNDLVYMETEVRNLGLRYQIMASIALWSKIEQILSKVAYNGLIYVLVMRYDKFWPYLCLHYHFRLISTLWAGLTILLSRCQVSLNWREMVHNDTICPVVCEVCPFVATFDAA